MTSPGSLRHDIDLRSVALDPKTLAGQDCVLVVTDHDNVNYALIGAHASLVVDTRNAMARVPGPKARIVKA